MPGVSEGWEQAKGSLAATGRHGVSWLIMASRATLLRWFHQGARAASLYLVPVKPRPKTIPPVYVCPECFRHFTEDSLTNQSQPDDDLLSEEHVPAQQDLGGKAMLLTCKRCNNRAGENLDCHAQRAERAYQLKYGGLKRPLRARMTIPELTWVATDFMLSSDGGHFVVKEKGGPKKNVEVLQAGFEAWLRDAATNALEIKLSFDGLTYDPRHEEASWLRSAYLATFAQFGYGLIGDPVYDVVREQIRNPVAELGLRPFTFPSPAPERWGLLVVKPDHEIPGIVVMMGRRFVQLPFPGDTTFWPRLHRVAERGTNVSLTGALRPWPKRPALELDEHNLSRRRRLDSGPSNTV